MPPIRRPFPRTAREDGARQRHAAFRLLWTGGRWWRIVAALAILPLVPLFAASAGAVPTPEPDAADPATVALGPGVYEITAGVFGTATDGLVGAETASGHVVQTDDRLVSLPACTVSSCPWLAPGSDVDPEWGPQSSCAEGDGLCWVELSNAATGDCVTAPVLDVGPYFVKDNWWAPRAERIYDLDQGVPAAEAAVDGADLGFGVGISDQGRDVRAAEESFGIGVAAGTWRALGHDAGAGPQPVRVRLLWQAELFQRDACGEARQEPDNATTTDEVNLRQAPNLDADVLTVLPGGRRVTVTGAPSGDFFPTTHGELTGWVSGDYLLFDVGNRESLAFTTDDVNFRDEPNFDAEVLRVLPTGALVGTTGEREDGFAEIVHNGSRGWVSVAYLAETPPESNESSTASEMTATDALNLRQGPSTDAPVLTIIPAGDRVELTGEETDGYRGVTHGDTEGWVAAEYLTTTDEAEDESFINELQETVDESVVEPVKEETDNATAAVSSAIDTVDADVVEPVAGGVSDAMGTVSDADDAVDGVVDEVADSL